jgi:hypothetical protein
MFEGVKLTALREERRFLIDVQRIDSQDADDQAMSD